MVPSKLNIVVRGRHWPAGTPFVGTKPGDWIFNDESTDAEPGHRVKWLRFACPRGHGECCVPIYPQTTGKGHTWKWDGNREAPTLKPSINCLAHNPKKPIEKYGGCGWHGHIVKGAFIECG